MPLRLRFIPLLFLGAAGPAAAQAPVLRGDAIEIDFGGRVQTQFSTTTVGEEPASAWRMRRVRLEARVKVNEIVGGKVQPDFAGDRLSLKDAYLLLRFAPELEVLVGRAHRPFSGLTLYSSLRMPPIEKGADIRGATTWDEQNLILDLDYGNRDVGLQILGEVEGLPGRPTYAVALFDGPLGGELVGRATYQLVARGTVSPAEDLSLGIAWSRRHFGEAGAVPPDPALHAGQAFLVDVAYNPDRGPFALAEVTTGDFDPIAGVRFRGAHAWTGYRFGRPGHGLTRIEPILRVSHGAIGDRPGVPGGGTLLTPGLNLYFGALNRVMVNYDAWLDAGDDDAGSLKVMFQMAF